MLVRSPRRPTARLWLVALLALLVSACARPGGSSVGRAAALRRPRSDPGAAIDVDALLRTAGAKDGQVVRVTGNFLADEAIRSAVRAC